MCWLDSTYSVSVVWAAGTDQINPSKALGVKLLKFQVYKVILEMLFGILWEADGVWTSYPAGPSRCVPNMGISERCSMPDEDMQCDTG